MLITMYLYMLIKLEQNFYWVDMIHFKIMKILVVLLGFEPRVPDSKSGVITTTL